MIFLCQAKKKACINIFELQDSLHASSKTHSSYLKSHEIREFFLSPQYHFIPIPLLPLSCFTQIHQTMEISPLHEISYRFTYNSPQLHNFLNPQVNSNSAFPQIPLSGSHVPSHISLTI